MNKYLIMNRKKAVVMEMKIYMEKKIQLTERYNTQNSATSAS
jgi:hypothetical protein